MSSERRHGIASVAYILSRDNAYADAIEDVHLRQGATTAIAMLDDLFGKRQVEVAARKMLKAIAEGGVPAVCEPHMENGPN